MTAGERWARDELLALRAARYRPAACQRFLAASFRRAGASRRARPGLTHQARTWSAAGLVAGLLARRVAAGAGLPAPTRRTWITWWLATATMLDWHLGMLEGELGQRRDRLCPADAITLARIGLVPFIAAADRGDLFTAGVAAAGATDLLDGRLARRRGTSCLGRELDTTADVAVKLAAARAAHRSGWLSPATTTVLAGCQAAGVVTVATAYFGTGRPPTGGLASPRWLAPVLLVGVAGAPHAPRAAAPLVAAASLGTLTGAVIAQARATGLRS